MVGVTPMSKRRKSVSLDEPVYEQVQDDDAEFSPLVNKWAEDYYAEGRRPAMKEQQVEQMLSDLNEREEQFEEFVKDTMAMFDQHRSMLKSALGDTAAEDDVLEEQFEDVYNELTERTQFTDYSTPRDPENPAIRQHANRIGVSPQRLVEELKERDRRDGFGQEVEQ
ncbi:hypothetical protein [Halalkalicoccus sp. NIPERK01]|uniref:hypothetical protein n=1 Tax=Halalkalicoccus sp. NIPERK01 TaxID=3053469 RepID=UPI00256F245D|nr:hypothetical protein [Halalkalicoccus sp. NIPERK01]MDL5361369.1 hypothetical protein [Halalkalicoccus sp. NIPERK01]